MPKTYVVLDLETTGLNPERDAILEIGAVKFRGDEVLDTFESLVNPGPGRSIPYNIQELTGIKPHMVKDAPSLFSLLPKLQRVVGKHPVVGHNIGFDLSFLARHNMFENNPSVDTFELASILLPHVGRYSLAMLVKSLDISLPVDHHRALGDCLMTHALFLALLDQADRLDLSVIQAINKAARGSDWALRPIFLDLEKQRARTAFSGSLGQQLAAKGGLSGGEGSPSLLEGFFVGEEAPLVPAEKPEELDVQSLAGMLEPGGVFDSKMPRFEHRPQQVQMLRRVTSAINHSEHLMIEAGTGTGKSVAYLVPAAHWAAKNGQRVVISTHTINLQDQLLKKDIPDLQSVLPIEFKAVALKGRSNYLCPYRVRRFQESLTARSGPDESMGSLSSDLQLRVLAKVLVWMNTTLTGDKQELFLPSAAENAIWGSLCSDPEVCSPERCRMENCFFFRARKAAESAHLIIVNHALLLADAAVDNRVLPDYRYLIVDEAHHLEGAITGQLGFRANQHWMARILSELSEDTVGKRRRGLLDSIEYSCQSSVPEEAMVDLRKLTTTGHAAVKQARSTLYEFFNAMVAFIDEHGPRGNQYDRRLRFTQSVRRQPAWDQIEITWDNLSVCLAELGQVLTTLKGLLDGLSEVHDIPDFDDIWSDLSSRQVKLERTREQLQLIIENKGPDSENTVAWAEMTNETRIVSICSAPVHVGEMVQRHIFDPQESVILTSATLRTEQNSDYMRERLGAMDVCEDSVGSPFDYQASTLLYLPTDIPEPNNPSFQRALESALIDLTRATKGRTLVLFTSYSHLRNTARAIREPLGQDNILVLEQGGGGSRAQLLESFKTEERCVLMGTRSFWEGIDVVGPQLSCVVIAKLPFAVPTDPIVSARAETYEDSFHQYSLPDTILRFRQGFGRLIRTRADRGVVVCMDRRVLSKQYGMAFVRSLPECTEIQATLADLPAAAAQWLDGE